MTYQELFKSFDSGVFSNVYFFYGEEEYVKEAALGKLRKKLLPAGLEALNESILEVPNADSIIADAETMPMMCDKRLVVAKEWACLKSGTSRDEANEVDKITNYLSTSPDSTCIVFYLQGKPDERKKLVKYLQKNATTVQFIPLNESDLKKWIIKHLKDNFKTISQADAQYLIFKVGQSVTIILQELNKLIAHSGESNAITRQSIDDIVTPSLECTVFEFIDKIIENKPAVAMSMLQSMLEAGESYISIIAMITRQVRLMMHVRIMQDDNLHSAEIEKRLEMTRFVSNKVLKQAQKFTSKSLKDLFYNCIDADYGFKSGRIRDDIAINRLVLLLFDAIAK